MKADALRPLLELQKEFPEAKIVEGLVASEVGLTVEAVEDKILELMDDQGGANG